MDLINKNNGLDAILVSSSGMMAFILDHNNKILHITIDDLNRDYQATSSKGL